MRDYSRFRTVAFYVLAFLFAILTRHYVEAADINIRGAVGEVDVILKRADVSTVNAWDSVRSNITAGIATSIGTTTIAMAKSTSSSYKVYQFRTN